ncbi:MAG: hypothetical protein ABSH12_06685 [Endomicrobiales bacterium]|jgi:hypothetical protein
MKKQILAVTTVLLCAHLAWALDQDSYRIHALGDSLAGFLADDYTDILANPARLGESNNKSYFGQIGDAGSPMTAGYFGASFGIIGSAVESLNQTEKLTAFDNVFNNGNTLSITKNESELLDLGILKSFHLNDGSSWGFALYPERNYSVNNVSSVNTSFSNNAFELPPTQTTTPSANNNELETLSLNLKLGYHTSDGTTEKDLILSSILQQTKQDSTNYSQYNYYNLDYTARIQVPYNAIFNSTSTTQVNPMPKVGFNFQYRTRTRIDDTMYDGTIFSVSWTPTQIQEQNTQVLNFSNSQVNISSNASSSNMVTGHQDNYQMFLGWGRTKEVIPQKLLMAFALNGNFTFTGMSAGLTGTSISQNTLISNYIFNGTISASLGAEYQALKRLVLRAGISPSMIGNDTESNYLFSDNSTQNIQSKSFTQAVLYSAGIGFTPVDCFIMDFYTTQDILDLRNLRAQLTYLF